jgi:hypothetical protein
MTRKYTYLRPCGFDTRGRGLVAPISRLCAGWTKAPSSDWPRLEGRSWQLVDPVQDVSFDRDGTETSTGLFVDLGAWQFHLLAIRPSSGLA